MGVDEENLLVIILSVQLYILTRSSHGCRNQVKMNCNFGSMYVCLGSEG